MHNVDANDGNLVPSIERYGIGAAPATRIVHDDPYKFITHSAVNLFQHLVGNSQRYMDRMEVDTFHERLMEMVMHELRIDLVNELHRNFNTSHTFQKHSSDLQQRTLRTSVSCSLQTFSVLAKKIHSSSVESEVHFFPAFNQTQTPSISADRFTIYFASIRSLSSAMGFNDNRDFETLFFREKCRDGTYYTRIIGSFRPALSVSQATLRDKNSTPMTLLEKKSCTSSTKANQSADENSDDDDQHTAHMGSKSERVETIFVGLSMNASLSSTQQQNEPEITPIGSATALADEPAPSEKTTNSKSSKVHSSHINISDGVALTRQKILWDEETNGYLCQWESHSQNIIIQPPPEAFFLTRVRSWKAFSLSGGSPSKFRVLQLGRPMRFGPITMF